MGSLALSLCHLAAGRVDAVVSLKPARSVDIAAAQLLVRERGLAIDLPEDEPFGAARLDLEAVRAWLRVRPRPCAPTCGDDSARRRERERDPNFVLRRAVANCVVVLDDERTPPCSSETSNSIVVAKSPRQPVPHGRREVLTTSSPFSSRRRMVTFASKTFAVPDTPSGLDTGSSLVGDMNLRKEDLL